LSVEQGTIASMLAVCVARPAGHQVRHCDHGIAARGEGVCGPPAADARRDGASSAMLWCCHNSVYPHRVALSGSRSRSAHHEPTRRFGCLPQSHGTSTPRLSVSLVQTCRKACTRGFRFRIVFHNDTCSPPLTGDVDFRSHAAMGRQGQNLAAPTEVSTEVAVPWGKGGHTV
jgi:hypothetical protein